MPLTEPNTASRPAHELLAWGRTEIETVLRSSVAGLPDSLRRVAGYQLGWWDKHENPTSEVGGKALRPTLTLLAAKAVSGPPLEAVPAAVAVELVHNFSLLHDDVMDGDTTRRHRPTAWTVFGSNAAILTGNALLARALELLTSTRHSGSETAIQILAAAVVELNEGQYSDLAFERRRDVATQECLDMIAGKTGALLGAACALGAHFGDADRERVEWFHRFGSQLGVAFQVVDDLLGIWGDPSITGKPAHADLRERKKSLPIVIALRTNTPAGHQLAKLYQRRTPLSQDDVVHAAHLIEATGAREQAKSYADSLLASALADLHRVAPTRQARAELTALAHLIVHRDH